MPSLQQLHGDVTPGRDGWSRALVQLAAPAARTAARGPGWQPVTASNHDPGATWLELVARPLWGLAAHAAGGGRAEEQWHQIRAALTAAVDPAHPWYVGPPGDHDQRIVESAAIGYAIAAAGHELWDPLTGAERDNLAAWLLAASRARHVDNNWHFFPVLAAAGLQSAGVPVDTKLITGHLDRLEEFALPGGWYSDGPGMNGHPAPRDYYVPFGFHFYGLLLGNLGVLDAGRADRFRERAVTFAGQFRDWFAGDGAALPFGRSLAYRLGQGAFWGLLAATDTEALPWDEARGHAERHLAWWWRQPIAAEDGGLTVGYAYPNSGVVEQYVAAGSPYWGTKFFAALAAAPGHPFWSGQPAPPPARETVSVQPAAAMILARDAAGDVVALNGQHSPGWNARGRAAKYAKFAYSTLAGFSVPAGGPDLESGAFDSTLALSEDGIHWRARTGGETELDGDTLVIRWSPFPDVQVETRLSHVDGSHRRTHTIVTGRHLHTAEGGFCVPWLTRDLPDLPSVPGSARVTGGGMTSEITDEAGSRRAVIGEPMPGSHVLFPRTLLPALHAGLAPGEHTLTCVVSVRRDDPDSHRLQ
ncbi:DUF2264 domain-containing protein [Longispora albida]|uniref:DUF2264 domain-containing protein n=1 Tax=Longispora albida TaxID=203523 RepID=UPI0009FBA7B2|nr:DUF2264 domain-containing protein [Longispora albida]